MSPHSVGNLTGHRNVSAANHSSDLFGAPEHTQISDSYPKQSYAPPTFVHALALVTRIDLLLVMLLPMLCGIMLAWWELGQVNVLNSLLSLFTSATYLFAIHLLAEYRDYRFGMAPEAKYVDERPVAGSNLLIRKLFLPHTVVGSSLLLFGLSTAGLTGLVLLAGWPVLFFLGLASLLYLLRMAPPPIHGYLGWGVGELGCFIGIGLLQMLNGYYVQSGQLTALPIYASIPAGFLAILVPFTHDLIYRRRDWISRKRTFPVALGDKRSLNFSALMILATYSSLFVLVISAAMPPIILISLVALPIMLGGFKQMNQEGPTPTTRLLFYRAVVKGSIVTWLLFLLALWIDKIA